MDVILDTNILYSLLREHGSEFAESDRFVDLTTYLRRTDSRLIIPHVVMEEFLARYADFISEWFKKTQDAWHSYNRALVSPHAFPLELHIDKELKKIKERLLNPAAGVHVAVFEDYKCAPTEEVVMRGIQRIRPASDKGEELRDVVIWLMTLECARNAPVCFIGFDGKFSEKDGLHSHLKRDLETRKVQVNFYRSIPEFIKGNALQAQSLAAAELAILISDEEIQEVVRKFVTGKSFNNKEIVAAEIGTPEFIDANQYSITADKNYIEAVFRFKSSIEQFDSIFFNSFTPFAEMDFGAFAETNLSEYLAAPQQHVYDQYVFPAAFQTPAFQSPFQQTFKTNVIPTKAQPTRTTTKGDVVFRAHFTLRVTSGSRQSLQLDKVFGE